MIGSISEGKMEEQLKKYQHIIDTAHLKRKEARMLRERGKELLARMTEQEAHDQVQKAENEISVWRMKNASNK